MLVPNLAFDKSLTDESADRRSSARSRLFVLVRAANSKNPMWAWDISLSGMQCRSHVPRWPGTYLDLEFRLPDTTECLQVGAQVVSIEEAAEGGLSLGLRFCRLSTRAQREIYRFLDRRRELWGKPYTPPAPIDSQLQNVVDEVFRPQVAQTRAHRPFEFLLREAYATLREKALAAPAARAFLPAPAMAA